MNLPSVSNSVINPVSDEAITENYTLVSERKYSCLWATVRHGRRVLLKGLPAQMCNRPELRALLIKEFELCMRMDHPSVVRVYGFEDNPELGPVIVMEYFDGVELGKYLEGKLRAGEQLRIALELAAVLEYIHSIGVAHRDLKPDNILIGKARRNLRLIDFGLGDAEDSVEFKMSAATRRYGAPEQADGAIGDARSDVYSFGRIVSEMKLPLVYRPVISRCLRVNPDDRPAMDAVSRSLSRISKLRSYVFPVLLSMAVAAVLAILFAGSRHSQQIINVPVHDTVERRIVSYDTVFLPVENPVRDTLFMNNIAAETNIITGDYNDVLADAIDQLQEIVKNYETIFKKETDDERLRGHIDARYREMEAVNDKMMAKLRSMGVDEGTSAQLQSALWARWTDFVNESDKKTSRPTN